MTPVLLHDGNAAALALADSLARMTPVTVLKVLRRGQTGIDIGSGNGAIICLSHATLKKFEVVRKAFGLEVERLIFVIPAFSNEFAPIFRCLGVRDYFVSPVDPHEIWRAISGARNRSVEASWRHLPAMKRETLIASRRTFAKLFDDVRNENLPDLVDLERTSKLICDASSGESLSHWLTLIRDHHDYTYRHSMFVCDIVVHFGRAMGMTQGDLILLSMGGLLHDIGKARIPLRILDKPGPLDEKERHEMRGHPSFSREILEKVDGLDSRIVSMAVHHHERLDGTGYPDGLKDVAIDDLARLTAIADIYSALIDERAYKEAMSPERALAWMANTRGHVDLEILGRFREFILDDEQSASLAPARRLQPELQAGER